MAITPRTLLRRPLIYIVLAIAGMFVVGAVAGYLVADRSAEQRPAEILVIRHVDYPATDDAPARRHTTIGAEASDAAVATDGPGASATRTACRHDQSAGEWGERDWLRYIGCLEEKGEVDLAILHATERALDDVGYSYALTLRKAELLDGLGRDQALLRFLEIHTSDYRGVSDGRLEHMLAHALVWRGSRLDFDRAATLLDRARDLRPGACETMATDLWLQYHRATRLDGAEAAEADRALRDRINAYLGADCHERIHEGQWSTLAETAGVGVAILSTEPAAYLIGNDLIDSVTQRYAIRHPQAFCREATPAQTGLWKVCEAKLTR